MGAPRAWQSAAAAVLVALPWLNPFASGPSPAVQPWLTTAACTLVLWAVMVAGGSAPRPRLLVPAAAIVGWAVLSQAAVRPEVVMLAGGLLLAGLAAGLARHEAVARGWAWGLLVAAATSAVFGLLQYFGLAAAALPVVNGAEPGHAYANLRQPNLFATLCWLGGAVVLWGPVRLRFAARALLVALFAAGCAASVSRTGLLQAVALITLAASWHGPQRRERLLLCAVGLVAYFAAALLLPLALQSVAGLDPARTLWERLGNDSDCSSRLVLWSNVLELVAERPWAGWGWGELDYAHYMHLYDGPRFCDILDNAHSLPLHLAVELGVPAAILIVGCALAWGWRQRPWREADASRQMAWAVLAVVLLHSLLEYPLWYGPMQVAFGMALGTLLPPRALAAPPAGRLRSGALAAVLLLATGYAAWDYLRVSQIYLPPAQRQPQWRDDTPGHVRRSWLFAGQAGFAELTLAVPARDNAAWMYAQSQRMLHYSPEPRVIERLVESATLLGRRDEAVLHLARYRAAFPLDYAQWRAAAR